MKIGEEFMDDCAYLNNIEILKCVYIEYGKYHTKNREII